MARLAASMSKVEHYHTELLREIISYLQEESEREKETNHFHLRPRALEAWAASDLSGSLRSFGLAPVKVPGSEKKMSWASFRRPSSIQVLLGCRYSALMPQMNDQELKELFEVTGAKLIDVAHGTTQVGILRC